MKIYTRTGDSGTTGLFGGPRVAKDDTRIEAYGTVDELNAFLGNVRVAIEQASDLPTLDSRPSDGLLPTAETGSALKHLDQELEQVQHELFSIGAELASPHPSEYNLNVIGQAHIDRLEHWIDTAEHELPPLKQFILPGGSAIASQLHLARAVCRRAERRVITLADAVESETPISTEVIVYLNRLSDWLFVASRWVNQAQGIPDQVWMKP